jgi:ACS family tartrate transporter-like MFS transporter
MDAALEASTMRKVYIRLLPFAVLSYVLAYIDRINVSFAALTMRDDLHMSAGDFGFAVGTFYWAYFLFEVPSNVIMEKVGARIWIARIMITWGIVSACTLFVTGPVSFYAVRFLLGMAEAGFFPGMILYLSYWFPARERARAVGFFMSAIAISYAIGAPLSGAIMSVFDGTAGLKDSQWLFLIEAVPAVLGGIFVWRYLDDGPAEATWLRADEKEWLAGRLESEEEARLERDRHSIGDALKDRRVLVFGLLYFCMVVNVYGLSFWVGEIVYKERSAASATSARAS